MPPRNQGSQPGGDTEVTLMSCELIFPKITLGASAAAQLPPRSLGATRPQAGQGQVPPRAVLWQGLVTIVLWPDPSPPPIPVPRAIPTPARGAEAASGRLRAGAAPLQTPQHSSHLCRMTQNMATVCRVRAEIWGRGSALVPSLPPSQHSWGLQRNTSHQPPHFAH